MEPNSWTWRMLDRALAERADVIAWREEDLADRRYHLLAIADASLCRLSRLVAYLSDRQFDQRIGMRHG